MSHKEGRISLRVESHIRDEMKAYIGEGRDFVASTESGFIRASIEKMLEQRKGSA